MNGPTLFDLTSSSAELPAKPSASLAFEKALLTLGGTSRSPSLPLLHGIAPTLRSMGHDGSHANGGGQLAIAFERRMVRTTGGQPQEELAHCLRSDTNTGDGAPCVATFQQSSQSGKGTIGYDTSGIAKPVKTQQDGQMIQSGYAVRRLTPTECERLQGFPDGHTQIPDWNGWRPLDEGEDPDELIAQGFKVRINKKTGKARVNDPDGPRYKALGNSMAVPCMFWIGERIQQIEDLTNGANC